MSIEVYDPFRNKLITFNDFLIAQTNIGDVKAWYFSKEGDFQLERSMPPKILGQIVSLKLKKNDDTFIANLH